MVIIVIMIITIIIITMIAGNRSPIKNSNFSKLVSAGGSFRVSSVVLRGTIIITNDIINIPTSVLKGLHDSYKKSTLHFCC